MVTKSEKRFIRLNLLTIIFTLLLILAGGIVRSSGSGMGCPDWPKCFGQYLPPTDVSELPPDYQTKYVAQRIAKNERFAKSLDKIGKRNLADRIRNDIYILQPDVFNAAKTWTEYINRLMGAVTGFLLLGLSACSFAYRKTAKKVIVLSFSNLLLVGFQAWLGSIVVSTNLLAWTVTVHMLLALVILAILVYTYNYTIQLDKPGVVVNHHIFWIKLFMILVVVVSTIQIILGTEVRESIDVIAKSLLYKDRFKWIGKLGEVFIYHRDMAVLVVLLNMVLYKILMDKFKEMKTMIRVGNSIVIVLIIQIATGIIIANFALPPYAQAIHILFSTLLFTLHFYLYLLVNRVNTHHQ